MAEFVEDIAAWPTQSLVVSCIDAQLQPYDFQDTPNGEFHIGVDFGKEQDFSIVLVMKKLETSLELFTRTGFPSTPSPQA
jgi:phage FluMu gp28-like protein